MAADVWRCGGGDGVSGDVEMGASTSLGLATLAEWSVDLLHPA